MCGHSGSGVEVFYVQHLIWKLILYVLFEEIWVVGTEHMYSWVF